MRNLDRKRATSLADTAFSKFIRLRGAWIGEVTENGLTKRVWINRCCTCNTVKPISLLQAGHYVSRGKINTRWREDNVHPQCKHCNGKPPMGLGGNYTEYARYMIRTYGPNKLDELARISKQSSKIMTYEIIEMIDIYKAKAKAIEDSQGVRYGK